MTFISFICILNKTFEPEELSSILNQIKRSEPREDNLISSIQYSKYAECFKLYLLSRLNNCWGLPVLRAVLGLIILPGLFPGVVHAATATYHLHNEASTTSGLKQLKTGGPDAAAVALQTDLTNKAVAEYLVQGFDTQSGVPNAGGVIPSGSTVSFTIWMKKTANVETMYPRVKLYLNNASGAQLCTATGTTAVSTTLTKYSLSCTTSSYITMYTTDRFYLWTGVNLTASSTRTVAAVVEIEGTLNGNYDSQIVAPLPNPPTISALTPPAGGVNTSVTITGTNFGPPMPVIGVVTFNGIFGDLTIIQSNTQIFTYVPKGATTGPVVVTIGGVTSNGMNFTVTPIIGGLTPSVGPVGTSVSISGATFGATQGTSTVTVNGLSATVSSWSDTTVVATVPPGATTGPVVVTVGGYASNGVTFTVSPAISGLTPNSGAVGNSVSIAGTNFGSTQGTSTVTFNGISATATSWSNTTIVATVPPGGATGLVVVTVGGNASNGVPFAVTPGISGLAPTSGAVGTSVTITGTNFGATQGTSTVTFNGVMAATTTWSDTTIISPVPAGASNGPVVVKVGSAASNSVGFTVPLYINTISPVVGPLNTAVTITGSSFGATQGISTITFSGTVGTPASWSDNAITVPVPAGAATGPVVVTNGGIASNGIVFSVSPQINSLSPQTGLIGTSVTISGASFGATQGTSTVTFNGVTATPTSWSDTSIIVPVPTGATPGPVVVTVGGSYSNGVTFTVLQITITYPTSGMTLNQPSTVVYGTLPAVNGDFIVAVNGKFAMVNGQNFAINNVDLPLGTDTITATLFDQTGKSATGSVSVQSNNHDAYVRLNSGMVQSLATMAPIVGLETVAPASISNISLTVGVTNLGSITTFPVQLSLPNPGIVLATVTVTTTDLKTYQGAFAFNVLDPTATETLLRSKWSNMQTALLAGDMTTAMNYFTLLSQGNYQAVLSQLQTVLPQIFNSIEGVYLLSVENEIAEMAALRTEGGVLMSYSIHFALDETGTWRITGF